MIIMLHIGDKFIIDTNSCDDDDLLDWYAKQENKELIALDIEEESNGVWVEECDYRIDLSDIILL